MKRFTVSFFFAGLCFFGIVAAGIGIFLLTTPRPSNIRECFTTSMFKVRLCSKDPNYARLQNISHHVRNAILVSEDGAFYSHQGIDWFELRESFEKNWEKGGFARGGSTITQQLAKNLYLSAEKSVLRKAREALIAVQIENLLSKDEIFEKYLNVVEFGPGIFGVSKAAHFYFNKSAISLTPAEGSFLAFLLPSPNKYGVSFRKKHLTPFARSRMNQIINRMYKFKKLSEVEHHEALLQVITFFGAPESPPELPDDIIEPSEEEAGDPSDSP